MSDWIIRFGLPPPPSIGNADSVFTMNEEHLPEHNFQMPETPNTSLPRNWVANWGRFYMKSPPLKGGLSTLLRDTALFHCRGQSLSLNTDSSPFCPSQAFVLRASDWNYFVSLWPKSSPK